MEGASRAATLTPDLTNLSSPALLSGFKILHVSIRNLTLDGGGADFANSNVLVSVTSAEDVVFDSVDVRNARGPGLLIQGGATHSGVIDSRFENLGNHWKTTKAAKIVFKA